MPQQHIESISVQFINNIVVSTEPNSHKKTVLLLALADNNISPQNIQDVMTSANEKSTKLLSEFVKEYDIKLPGIIATAGTAVSSLPASSTTSSSAPILFVPGISCSSRPLNYEKLLINHILKTTSDKDIRTISLVKVWENSDISVRHIYDAYTSANESDKSFLKDFLQAHKFDAPPSETPANSSSNKNSPASPRFFSSVVTPEQPDSDEKELNETDYDSECELILKSLENSNPLSELDKRLLTYMLADIDPTLLQEKIAMGILQEKDIEKITHDLFRYSSSMSDNLKTGLSYAANYIDSKNSSFTSLSPAETLFSIARAESRFFKILIQDQLSKNTISESDQDKIMILLAYEGKFKAMGFLLEQDFSQGQLKANAYSVLQRSFDKSAYEHLHKIAPPVSGTTINNLNNKM